MSRSGNPDGKPVLVVHGGPGGGSTPKYRQFFDPTAFRIIQFDQRGCGHSTPFACLDDNTTWHLVADMERLRSKLGLEKWMVFGGSWGSTLSLSYAEAFPQRVTELVLRGIFMLRKKEIDWFYQGGAANTSPPRCDGGGGGAAADIEDVAKAVCCQRGPKSVVLEEGKTYWYCQCGRSKNQPFCDGSHKGTGIGPKKVVVPKGGGGKKHFCMCRQTGNPPYCDGSHSALPKDAKGCAFPRGHVAKLKAGRNAPLPAKVTAAIAGARVSFDPVAATGGTAIGAAALYPDAWEAFEAHIPPAERGDMVAAYYRRLCSDDAAVRAAAARAWSVWEGSTSHLELPSKEDLDRYGADAFSDAFARIECHYFSHGGFFASDEQLIDNVGRIRHIPCGIVQGRYDCVCPAVSAWELARAWPEAELIINQKSGHSCFEPENQKELVLATERFKN